MRHIIWRNRASAILGILIMIIPFTGFPESLRTAFVVLFGLLIAVFGFSREPTFGYSFSQPELDLSVGKGEQKDDVVVETMQANLPEGEKIEAVTIVRRKRGRKMAVKIEEGVSEEKEFLG